MRKHGEEQARKIIVRKHRESFAKKYLAEPNRYANISKLRLQDTADQQAWQKMAESLPTGAAETATQGFADPGPKLVRILRRAWRAALARARSSQGRSIRKPAPEERSAASGAARRLAIGNADLAIGSLFPASERRE
jgi:hypothetical protein